MGFSSFHVFAGKNFWGVWMTPHGFDPPSIQNVALKWDCCEQKAIMEQLPYILFLILNSFSDTDTNQIYLGSHFKKCFVFLIEHGPSVFQHTSSH